MKFITKEEMEKEPWQSRGNGSKLFKTILTMEVGQILLIEPADWGERKYPPTALVRYIVKKYKRKYTSLRHASGKGWIVERLS